MIQFCILFLLAFSLRGPQSELITKWPGLDTLPAFQMYSGYLDASSDKHLHYLFVESESNADAPLVVWLNGGPGCSSLDGLLYEHGPLLISEDGSSFKSNPHSWNTVAHMLYIESPIGVGFSYSDTGNYTIGDYQTAKDGATALIDFFNKFSLPYSYPLYITGESYGGVYVPMLTLQVAKEGTLNIKGFAVGNGLSSYDINDNSLMFFAHYHGLISKTDWASVTTACCDKGVASQDNCDFGHDDTNQMCVNETNKAMGTIYQAGLNFYDLYGDCISTQKYERSLDNLFRHLDLEKAKEQHLGANVPCIDSNGANIWLNEPSVREALHVTPSKLGRWEICSDQLDYQREITDMQPFYLALFTSYGIPGYNYNGDTDMACNFLGNEWFSYELGQKVTQEWSPWSLPGDNQVSGFYQQFGLLHYYTVKGAGHMVPQWRPEQGLYILSQMIGQ